MMENKLFLNGILSSIRKYVICSEYIMNDEDNTIKNYIFAY